MKRSRVNWVFNFIRGPTESQRVALTKALGSADSLETTPDHDAVWREIGLSSYQFIEPWEARDAASLGLHCLSRAHLLATGWRIGWPAITRKHPDGFTTEELRFAAQPESMSTFCGGISRDEGTIFLEDTYSIGFKVFIEG